MKKKKRNKNKSAEHDRGENKNEKKIINEWKKKNRVKEEMKRK